VTTLPRRLAALGTAALTVAMVAVLWLGAAGAPVSVGPSSSPSQSSSPSGSQDPLDVFARIEDQVSELRGLPPPDIGPPDVISRDQLAVELRAVLDEQWTPEQLARDNLTLRAMGLLTDHQDLRVLTETLLTAQVLGFYDFEERRMVVVTDAGVTPEAEITYAHEFTHAMQDAAFDTGQERDPHGEDDDAALAELALEEGDATVAMFRWAFANLSPDELAELAATPVPDTSGVPQWMLRQLEFPYLAGATWVAELWTSGGWDAVDAAYDRPPASTEQVLHPEKYQDAEPPLVVHGPDLTAKLGAGWRDVESITIGEAMLAIWLEELGISEATASQAAAGWGGDQLVVSRGPDGEWVLAWRLTWDEAAEAAEFDDAYAQITADLPIASAVHSTGASGRLVLHASSDAALRALETALGS
jgi:hypothetical protein